MSEYLTHYASGERKILMSSRASRPLQRKNNKQKIKRKKQKLDKQLKLNKLLPNKCTVCTEAFDETNKKMINEWHIVIEHNETSVNLYCPTCWEKQI
jgi:hypothetical protein